MQVVSVATGKCTFEMTVEEEHLNSVGTLHSGLSATLVDLASTLAISTIAGLGGRIGGTVDLNVT